MSEHTELPLSPEEKIIRSRTSLLASGKYSDLTVVAGARNFKVHRAIVCPQSKVFSAMCDDGFKESLTAQISLDDDHPDAVERMITYLYRNDYDDGGQDNVSQEVHLNKPSWCCTYCWPVPRADAGSRMMLNVRVYSLADKYDIAEMKILAKSKFEALLKEAWSHIDFASVVEEIFDTTPKDHNELRQLVSRAAATHMKDLLDHSSDWRNLIIANGEISLAMLKVATENHEEGSKVAAEKLKACRKELEDVRWCKRQLHGRFDE